MHDEGDAHRLGPAGRRQRHRARDGIDVEALEQTPYWADPTALTVLGLPVIAGDPATAVNDFYGVYSAQHAQGGGIPDATVVSHFIEASPIRVSPSGFTNRTAFTPRPPVPRGALSSR